jgi:phosphate transport system protein
MDICNPHTQPDIRESITDSLPINKCTVRAIEYTIEMVRETEDRERLKELAAKIEVEASKTDDIYSMLEKEILQNMDKSHKMRDEYFNLLKYIRKNLKIIDRLEDIASKLMFARIGGLLD